MTDYAGTGALTDVSWHWLALQSSRRAILVGSYHDDFGAPGAWVATHVLLQVYMNTGKPTSVKYSSLHNLVVSCVSPSHLQPLASTVSLLDRSIKMATVDEKAGRHDSLDDGRPKTDHVAVVKTDDGFEQSLDAARAANDEEHTTTVMAALKIHWKAVMWSLIVSMSIIMEGYDTSLITNFFAYPAFKDQFGQQYPDGRHEVAGKWQSALGAISTAG